MIVEKDETTDHEVMKRLKDYNYLVEHYKKLYGINKNDDSSKMMPDENKNKNENIGENNHMAIDKKEAVINKLFNMSLIEV